MPHPLHQHSPSNSMDPNWPQSDTPPPQTATLRSPPPISTAPPKSPKAHSLPPEKIEIFKSLESWASQCVLPLLKPVEQIWQPQNLLPDSSLPYDEFADQVRALRYRTAELPDEYFVVLVGEMITEDAVPTYQSMVNSLDGVRDEIGSGPNPWAVWNRSWTAEENRHGDLLRTYLYVSGRVDMRVIEKTVQYLIGAGMKRITMPAHLMYDGHDPRLFEHFAAVTQRLGVYTGNDYADILEFLVGQWRLEKLEDLTDEGKRAQDFVCGLAPRIRKLIGRADEQARKMEPHGVKFSWIFNKEVLV